MPFPELWFTHPVLYLELIGIPIGLCYMTIVVGLAVAVDRCVRYLR
jgi:hypothetical protein